MPFKFGVDEIIATYKKHNVKPACATWYRGVDCMCPMNVMAADALANGGTIQEGIDGFKGADTPMENREVIAKALGVDSKDVGAFVGGFDGDGDNFGEEFIESRKFGQATYISMVENGMITRSYDRHD